jgi:NAD+ synthase (glutamine-hydrolysing)
MMGRELTWQKDDLTLQNIQARTRAPMAWIVANIKGAILLATSNRSEAAVGYATMDGDTAGGLAPLGGIDKPFLREWLCWMEQEATWGRGRIAALALINQQAPTAELRPQQEAQRDEDDLMPYTVLSRIERLLVRDHMGPQDILALLQKEFTGYDRPTLESYLRRFLKLFTQNQWKRERYAPSFHLDDASLDPKTWWRFPILSGGFKDEMDQL